MCQFAEATCGGFTALSQSGYLHATVSNEGVIASAYTLSVTNCSQNIGTVVAQKLSLSAGESQAITPFEIVVQDSAAVDDRHCYLVLYNAAGAVTDSAKVTFYTNATEFENKPANRPPGETPYAEANRYTPNNAAGSRAGPHCAQQPNAAHCDDACSSFRAKSLCLVLCGLCWTIFQFR